MKDADFLPGGRSDVFEGQGVQQSSAMRLLRSSIAQLAGDGVDGDAQKVWAIQAWAMVHGLAMLMLDGQIPADDELIAATIRSYALNDLA